MRLDDVANSIKSTNAGASMLTFDIGFADEQSFRHVADGGYLTPRVIHRLYGVAEDDVRVYAYAPALIIKITIPRSTRSGGIAERDFDGTQQFAPLLDVDVG